MIEKEETDFLQIQISKVKCSDGGYVMSINDPELEYLHGCIVQGNSEEDAKKQLKISLDIMVDFLEEESKNYAKRAIWRSYGNKNHWWFTIIGIGFSFYIQPKDFEQRIKQYSNYTPKKSGFWIGRLRISFTNNWKNIKSC